MFLRDSSLFLFANSMNAFPGAVRRTRTLLPAVAFMECYGDPSEPMGAGAFGSAPLLLATLGGSPRCCTINSVIFEPVYRAALYRSRGFLSEKMKKKAIRS